jgi:hypothetical protein
MDHMSELPLLQPSLLLVINCFQQSFFLALPTHSNQPGWTTSRQANTTFFLPQPLQAEATTTLD